MGVLKTQFQQIYTNIFLWTQRYCCKKDICRIFRVISKTADGWLYPALATFVIINESRFGNPISVVNGYGWRFVSASALAFAIQIPLYIYLKHKFKRNRPQDKIASFTAQIKPADRFSFPSGHTAAAFVMASQICLFYPVFAFLALSWACLVGLSRVILGVHYPGDILAGVLLGSCSAMFATQLVYVHG